MSDVASAENGASVTPQIQTQASRSQSAASSNPGGARPPSLNQLAARINAQSPPQPQGSSLVNPLRPRLPTELLRTSSQMSVHSATTIDSMAVNVSTTRSTSPALSTSPPHSTSSTPSGANIGLPEGDSDLTAEKLEKFNLNEDKPAETIVKKDKPPRGYKNIPSLDAITERMKKARTLSVDGSAMPSPGGTGLPGVGVEALDKIDEFMKEREAAEKKDEHPLQFPWTIYHDSKPRYQNTPSKSDQNWTPPPTTESGAYEAQLTVVGEFSTVESFCRYFNWLKPPSKLEKNSNYHLFKDKIKPMWEDEANANGGKWVLTMRNNPLLLDRCWSYLTMALVGEELEDGDELCGAVVSLRSKVDRIQLWTRTKTDIERLNSIARKMIKLLDLSEADNVGLEFQYNSDDHPPPNKFISMASSFSFPQSSMRSTFPPNPHQSPLQQVVLPLQQETDNSVPDQQALNVGAGTAAGGAFGGFPGGAFGTWRKPR